MDIQAEKILLAKLLLETENLKVIQSVKKIFMQENALDFWDELSAEQRDEIEKASAEIKLGEVTDYDSFLQKHR